MIEHEKLKEICDTIGYKTNFFYKKEWYKEWYYQAYWNGWRKVKVCEIIFTQEFMDKYRTYINLDLEFSKWIILHLNNPVDYLYNTLKLWKQ